MREILFRGKRMDNEEWVGGYLAAYDMICPSHTYPVDTVNATGLFYGLTPYVGFVDVEPATIGQYTGMTDENGVRVYEGDIVDVLYDVAYVGVSAERVGLFEVVFHDGCFMKKNQRGLFHFIRSDKCRVIGNIHDNPKLLEGGQNDADT